MAKKITAASLKGKSLYDVVVTKSAKFVEKMKAPIIKTQLKRTFATNVSTAVSEIYDLKAMEIELLMNVKNIDVARILEINEKKADIYKDICGMAAIYLNIFGEDLPVEITEEDLNVSTADVMSAAVEVDEDDED